MQPSIPKMMRAVILNAASQALEVKEVPVPQPASGQVLIKMEASPINPSDLGFLTGHYSTKKTLPSIPGFEGSGLVVQSGGGLIAWKVNGSRVAVAANESYYGCWAEYMVADAINCLPVDETITFENAACSFVNPLTVVAFLELAKNNKHNFVIHTVGASSLGRMMNRLFAENGIQVINIVRRKEQEELLAKEGVKIVLNQTDPDFDEKLREICQKNDVKCCFDAVAGELTGRILKGMAKKGIIYVYGGLSLKGCVVDPTDLIFRGKEVKGFWLREWLNEKSLFAKARVMMSLRGQLKNSLKTVISKEFSLEEANEAIAYYKSNMSEGKVLIKPSLKK